MDFNLILRLSDLVTQIPQCCPATWFGDRAQKMNNLRSDSTFMLVINPAVDSYWTEEETEVQKD
jgi:hypothetical protein